MSSVVNLICFVICLVCIVAGTTISILAIWGVEKNYVVLKSLLTFGVIFLASLLTITVNNFMPVRSDKENKGKSEKMSQLLISDTHETYMSYEV